MVQSPSWEANWFAASQEIPRILWNSKVHYRTHKRPPPVPILGQPNPVHIPTSHLLEIHPNIIYTSTPRSPQWSISLWFPHQDPICPPLLTQTRHMPSPSHSSRFYHPHNIGWGVQIIKLLVMQSPFGTAIRKEMKGPRGWVWFLAERTRFSSSPKQPYQLCVTNSLICNVNQEKINKGEAVAAWSWRL